MIVLNSHIEHHLQGLEDKGFLDNEQILIPEQNGTTNAAQDGDDPNNERESKEVVLLSYAIVAILGYTIGIGHFTWTIFAWFLGIVWMSQQLWQFYMENRHSKCQRLHLATRLEIMKCLGTMGAPALKTQTYEFRSADFAKIILQLVKAQVDLFAKMDRAIEILRMTTGMQLGVGPYSPSVERVELSTTKPILAKRLLADTMLDYRTVLMQLLDAGDDETRGPQVITLFWLKKTKRDLSGLVANVVDELLLTNTMSGCLKQDLAGAIVKSREASEFIDGIFGCSRNLLTGHTSTSQLHQQIGAAQAALWAFEQEINEVTRHKWWVQFQGVLRQAKELNELLFKNEARGAKTEIAACETEKATETQREHQHEDFEDFGRSPSLATAAFKTETRILVFSGRGKSYKSTVKMDENSLSQKHVMIQSMMLNELQNRLATLEKPEEFEANDLPNEEEDEDGNTTNEWHCELTSAVLPVPSQQEKISLLSELHLALTSKHESVADSIFAG